MQSVDTGALFRNRAGRPWNVIRARFMRLDLLQIRRREEPAQLVNCVRLRSR
jgi:hypothetical protein